MNLLDLLLEEPLRELCEACGRIREDSLFFIFTSIGHFISTEGMAAMLPPSVPYRIELIYLTGVLELLEL